MLRETTDLELLSINVTIPSESIVYFDTDISVLK